jgi:hypothetical protein
MPMRLLVDDHFRQSFPILAATKSGIVNNLRPRAYKHLVKDGRNS